MSIVFRSSCNISQSRQQCTRLPVSPVLANTCYFPFGGSSHPSGCEVVSHVALICLPLQTNAVQPIGHLHSFFAEMSIQIVHFKIRLFVFLLLDCESSLCVLDTRFLSDICFVNTFSLTVCLFTSCWCPLACTLRV